MKRERACPWCVRVRVCVALPQQLGTFDLASISSLSNQTGYREGWCDTSPCVFSLFVRNTEAVWRVGAEVFFKALYTLSATNYFIYHCNYVRATDENFATTF